MRGAEVLGLAVQLVAPALDVVEAVEDDDVAGRQGALDGAGERGARVLLRGVGRPRVRRQRRGREVVRGAGDGLRLVRDEVQAVAGGGRLRLDAVGEVVVELLGAGGFARGRQAGDYYELVVFLSATGFLFVPCPRLGRGLKVGMAAHRHLGRSQRKGEVSWLRLALDLTSSLDGWTFPLSFPDFWSCCGGVGCMQSPKPAGVPQVRTT